LVFTVTILSDAGQVKGVIVYFCAAEMIDEYIPFIVPVHPFLVLFHARRRSGFQMLLQIPGT
jgi:hypothetical protein